MRSFKVGFLQGKMTNSDQSFDKKTPTIAIDGHLETLNVQTRILLKDVCLNFPNRNPHALKILRSQIDINKTLRNSVRFSLWYSFKMFSW